jgi:hypothetical protein
MNATADINNQMVFNTQFAWAFLNTAYTIRKKQPIIFISKYIMDWLPIILRLFKLKADRENIAPVQPMASSIYFRNNNISLYFYAKQVQCLHFKNANIRLTNAQIE